MLTTRLGNGRSRRPQWRTIPPVTLTAWPVMNRALSEHRNWMTSATSSGSHSRPSGVCVDVALADVFGFHAPQLTLPDDLAVLHRRADAPGAHRVHPHAETSHLPGHALGQAQHGPFRGGVVRQERRSLLGGGRGDGHDAALVPGHHGAQDLSCHQEHALWRSRSCSGPSPAPSARGTAPWRRRRRS